MSTSDRPDGMTWPPDADAIARMANAFFSAMAGAAAMPAGAASVPGMPAAMPAVPAMPAMPSASPFYFLDPSALARTAPACLPMPTGYAFSPDVVPYLGAGRRVFEPEAVRRDFPILQQSVNGRPLVWLDNAATTQKPQSVIDRISRFYEEENSNIHRAAHALAARATDAYEASREKVKTLPQRQLRQGHHLRPRHHRRREPGRAKLGPAPHRQRRRDRAHLAGAPLEHRAVAAAGGREGREDPRRADRRRRAGAARRVREAAEPAHAAGVAGARLQRARHGDAGRRDDRDGAPLRRARAGGRRAGRVAHAGGRPGARLRLLCLLGPQDVRADRHRRRLRQARGARADAALAGRRQHDRRRHLREDDVPGAARHASRPAPAASPTPWASAPPSTTSSSSAWRRSRATSTS